MEVAIIGCGRMGAQSSSRLKGKIPPGWLPIAHAESVNEIPELKLVALCDVDSTLLNKVGQHYQVDKLYTDYQEMLSEIKPEIITIATRTPVKREIIQHACEAGVKGIYVEKPLANSLGEAQIILNCVKEYNVKLLYGVNRRYHPVYREAKKLIQQGVIGDLRCISIEHGQAQLLWTHPHTVDLMLYYTDETQVDYVQASLLSDTYVQDGELKIDSDPRVENAFFKFQSGVNAGISSMGGNNVRINGDRGTLTIDSDGAFIQINQANNQSSAYYLDQKTIYPLVEHSATTVALSELMESVMKNKQLGISLNEIEAGTKMLLSCVWSFVNQGRLVLLDELPRDFIVTGKYGELYA